MKADGLLMTVAACTINPLAESALKQLCSEADTLDDSERGPFWPTWL